MVAEEKGFFKEAGLDVNIIGGYGGNRTANELDQGLFEFGHVDSISMLLNRKNGGKIRFIGTTNTRSPAVICYTARPSSSSARHRAQQRGQGRRHVYERLSKMT